MNRNNSDASLDREGAKSFLFFFGLILMLGVLPVAYEILSMIFPEIEEIDLPDFMMPFLIWYNIGLFVTAVSGLAVFLIRCVTERFSRNQLMIVLNGGAALLITLLHVYDVFHGAGLCYSITNLTIILVPPLLGVMILHVMIGIVRRIKGKLVLTKG